MAPTPSQTPSTPRIPARHQQVINSVVNPHHTLSAEQPTTPPHVSPSEPLPSSSSISLLDSNSSQSSLGSVRLLPQPEAPAMTTSDVVPVAFPVLVPSINSQPLRLPRALPPTPSGAPPPTIVPILSDKAEELLQNEWKLPPTPSGAPPPNLIPFLPTEAAKKSKQKSSEIRYSYNRRNNETQSKSKVKPPKNTSSLPGMNPQPSEDHPVKHL